MATTKDLKKLIDALNIDRAYELAAVTQYMGHHYEVKGMDTPSLEEIFKGFAIDEMKHAESLAERICYLGGVPVQKATTNKRGGTSKKMIQDDLGIELKAIARYTSHIKLANKAGDTTTRKLLEGILADEEGHADTFQTLLGK